MDTLICWDIIRIISIPNATIFFPSSFTSNICNPLGYGRLRSLRTRCNLVFTPSSTISALSCRCEWQRLLGKLIPSWVYPSRSSPAWSFFFSHSSSLSLAPSLPPISVACKNLSSGFVALSLASNATFLYYAIHIFCLMRTPGSCALVR